MRGLGWVFANSLLLLALAGCTGWFAQREPWRREAEEQCMKSGAVREGPAVALLRPIDGPGICGADFPLKVAAIGDTAPLGYADELRPPGSVPQPLAGPPGGYSRPVSSSYPQPYPPQLYPAHSYPSSYPQPNGPMSIH